MRLSRDPFVLFMEMVLISISLACGLILVIHYFLLALLAGQITVSRVADIGISICSFGLVVFMLPTLLNKAAQVPRKSSSIPVAFFLSLMIPFFYIDGLLITVCTLTGQAVVWWLIAIFRPIRRVEV